MQISRMRLPVDEQPACPGCRARPFGIPCPWVACGRCGEAPTEHCARCCPTGIQDPSTRLTEEPRKEVGDETADASADFEGNERADANSVCAGIGDHPWATLSGPAANFATTQKQGTLLRDLLLRGSDETQELAVAYACSGTGSATRPKITATRFGRDLPAQEREGGDGVDSDVGPTENDSPAGSDGDAGGASLFGLACRRPSHAARRGTLAAVGEARSGARAAPAGGDLVPMLG